MLRIFSIGLLLSAVAVAADPLADTDHRDALIRYGIGRMKSRDGLPVQAIQQFETAAKADPVSPAPLRPLVKLYADVGRDLAAIRTAEKVLELDPDDADTAHALGKLLYEAKQYPEAIRRLKQAADSPRVADKPARRYPLLRDVARASAAGSDWVAAETALRAADQLLTNHRDALQKSLFDSPTELDRERAAVQEKLGEALAGQKKTTEAITAYKQAHDLARKAGDTISAARLDWNLSGALSNAGKVDEALTHLNRFLALKPSGPTAYERLADLLRRAGQSQAIPGTLARLADENPKNESVRWVLATELTQDNPAAAARLFGELAEKTTAPEFCRRWVRFYKDTGRLKDLLDEMDRQFRAAHPAPDERPSAKEPPEVDPNTVNRARALAAAVKAEPELSGVLTRQALADAVNGRDRSIDTWELVAALAERDGQLNSVEQLLGAAARTGNERVELALLRVLARQRKWRQLTNEAATIIRRHEQQLRVGQKGRSLAPEIYQATALAELGEDEQALAMVKRIGQIAADQSLGRRQKIAILNILGQHKEAVAECQTLLTEATKRDDVHVARSLLANSYLGLREYQKSEAELRLILDDDPDDAETLNNLGYNLADQGRNLPEAEAMIRRAMEIDRFERTKYGTLEPETGTYLDSLGWVLFRRGKLTEARELLERATKLPDTMSDAVVWDHLGDVCFRLNDKPTARKAWSKAADQYTDSHTGRQQDRLKEVRRKLKLVP